MLPASVDLSLYLVTDTAMCGAFGVEATVAAAVAAGVTAVQVRDPVARDDEFVELARAVGRRLAGTGVPMLVNDRVQLVRQVGAQGAHIGQSDLDPETARDMLGPEAILGLSVQTPDHVAAARRYAPGVIDYLGVGPVWAQTTKPDASAPGGLAVLRAIAAASPWPCVAIGGITAERVGLVRRAGAAGAAVVSAICGHSSPGDAAGRLRREWDESG